MVLQANKNGWEMDPEIAVENPYLDDNGVKWFLLSCRYQFGDWIETNDTSLWQAFGERHRARYWVHEALMMVILLKKV